MEKSKESEPKKVDSKEGESKENTEFSKEIENDIKY